MTRILKAEETMQDVIEQFISAYNLVSDITPAAWWYENLKENGQVEDISFSPKLREMLGYKSIEDFPDKVESLTDNIHPDDLARIRENAAAARVEKIDKYDVQYRIRKADGGYMWCNSTGQIVKDCKGRLVGMFGAFTDITSHIEASEAHKILDEKARHFENLAKHYADKYEAVMVANLCDGLFKTVSAKEGVMTDAGTIPFSEAVLKNVLKYVHETDRQMLVEEVGDFEKIRREYGIGESRDFEYRSSNGKEYVWYCMTLNRISEEELLIALRNCNDEVNARIVDNKLLEKYESVYLIDLIHGKVRSAKPSKVSKVGGFSGEREYTEIFKAFAETVAPKYKQDWLDFGNPDYMKKYMADQDMREYIYELPEAEKKMRRLTIDVTERVNGEASTLMMSFAGVDDISARNIMLQGQLQESLTFTNFFLDTYISAYYVNFEDYSCQVYKRTEELEQNYPIVTNYMDSITEYINCDVHLDDRKALLDITQPDRMKKVLMEKSEYSHIFRDISDGIEKTYRMQVIRGADENHAAFGFIDISDEVSEQKKRLETAEEARKLVDNIAARYSVAFTVNMVNDNFKILKLDRKISHKFEEFSNYHEARESLRDIIHVADKERIMHEMQYDTMREKLKKTKSYTLEYRTAIAGVTKWHEMNITAIDNEEVAMGFSEKDLEITKRRLEDKRYDEYLALYVIDLDTEMVKPLKTSPLFGAANVGEAVPYEPGMSSFAAAYQGEAEDFFERISKIPYLKEAFAQDDKRTYSFKSKLLGGDKWIDAVSYVILRHEDGTPAMLSLGFVVVDAIASARKELLDKLNENMQMIGGLASGYSTLYYINIDENLFNIYSLDEEMYPDAHKAFDNVVDFYDGIRGYGQSEHVHPDDRHLFDDFNVEAIREKLKGNKKYSIRFRTETENGYRWDEMDVIKYEEPEEQANAIAVGFSDRDAGIRAEQALNNSFDVLGRGMAAGDAIDRILSIAGEYYGAERCYVFEYIRKIGIINNTYEWCAEGVEPMIEKLQDVPLEVVEGWNNEFNRQGAFYMDALDSEHNTEETRAILEMQGIESLVAAPLMSENEIVGFIGVDNPTKAKKDINILSKASSVVFSEILQRKENDEEHVTLDKLTDAFLSVYYADLKTDYMRTWKIDEEYKEEFGAVQNYSISMGGYVREGIAARDRDRCILMTSPEYIMEQFRDKDRFSIDMTDIMLGYERDIVFDYIKVNDEGNQVVICCRDVTETIAREKQYQKKLEEARNFAEAANKAKTDFLFNMSHDIRTPMNAITGFTNMAIKHIDDKKRVLDCLSKTQHAGSMLLSLINSVLEMSRIESGNATLEHQHGDVYYSFANIEGTLGELADAKDIKLSFEFGEIEDRYVFADFSRCMRVFVNVISNAIKYTAAGGFVKVRCQQIERLQDGKGLYQYTIEDNGIGMSEEFQKRVFDQFAREETATVSGIEGSGLGLSVSKSFVELMGGTIECRSKQGVGTTFVINLPFEIQEEEIYTDPVTGAVKSKSSESETIKEISFRGETVLLVEDNELNREIALDILEEEGLVVEEADDGTVAVEMLKEKGPDYYDFILMDIQMPKMNGYEATKAIRNMYPDSKLPIIALSANAFAEDKQKSLEAGMNDHVAKPIDIIELFNCLAKYL